MAQCVPCQLSTTDNQDFIDVSMAVPKFRKYYIKGDTLPLEEDSRNEFKGHLNLCKEEIPHWALENKSAQEKQKSSRKPVSRNINAFLNSGNGGTVFLGVLDTGHIKGFHMSRLQRDHFLKSLDDLMSRYKPPVLAHQYSVLFTPVFDKIHTPKDIEKQLEFIGREEIHTSYKNRKHVFRDSNLCWCDKDATAYLNINHKAQQLFVVEVIIKPWDPYDTRNPSAGTDPLLRIQPYYSDEEGKVYFRRQASVVQYDLSCIAQITRQEVKDRYEEEIRRLKEEIADLECKKAANAKRLTNCPSQ